VIVDLLGHENGSHRTQENGVAAEEGKEFRGGREDFPLRLWSAGNVALGADRPTYGNETPATNKCCK
jgi:hypothetical protein